VVLRAGSFLRDGDRVRAVPAKQTATASARAKAAPETGVP